MTGFTAPMRCLAGCGLPLGHAPITVYGCGCASAVAVHETEGLVMNFQHCVKCGLPRTKLARWPNVGGTRASTNSARSMTDEA